MVMESVENIEAWRAEISVDDDQWPSEPAIPHLNPHLPTEELSDVMAADCSHTMTEIQDIIQWTNYK